MNPRQFSLSRTENPRKKIRPRGRVTFTVAPTQKWIRCWMSTPLIRRLRGSIRFGFDSSVALSAVGRVICKVVLHDYLIHRVTPSLHVANRVHGNENRGRIELCGGDINSIELGRLRATLYSSDSCRDSLTTATGVRNVGFPGSIQCRV